MNTVQTHHFLLNLYVPWKCVLLIQRHRVQSTSHNFNTTLEAMNMEKNQHDGSL